MCPTAPAFYMPERSPQRLGGLRGAREGPLHPWREHRARQLRVGRAIAAPASDRGERAEDHALHPRWRLAEDDDVGELLCEDRQLQRMGHALVVRVPEPS